MLLLSILQILHQPPQPPPSDFLKRAHTYSIVAYDSVTGDLGIAVQSKFPNVGGLVPWARAGIGAVATQALSNTDYGEKGLDLLARGATAPEAMRIIMRTDPQPSQRQVGMVDAHGNSASWTGDSTFDWAGGRTGGPSGRRQEPAPRRAPVRRASEHHGVGRDGPKHGGDVRAEPRVARGPVDRGSRRGTGRRWRQTRHAVGGAARCTRAGRLPWRHGSLHRYPRVRRTRSDQGAAAAVRAAQALFLHHRFIRSRAHYARPAEGAGGDSARRAREPAAKMAGRFTAGSQ